MDTPASQGGEETGLSSPTTPKGDRRLRRGLALLLVLTTSLAYLGSFSGALLLDDEPNIERALAVYTGDPSPVLADPLGQLRFPYNRRPLTDLTLLANHALGGLDPWGYHLFNLLVHLSAVLVLFGLVRRTMLLPRFEGRFRRGANGFAFAASLIWSLHPLCTQAVTYVVQRGESLMALFYLLTLYVLVRATTAGPSGWRWIPLAFVTALLGTTSKEVMITAPLALVAFDFVFLGGWFPGTRARRMAIHGATWLGVFGYLALVGVFGDMFAPDPTQVRNVGFGFRGVSSFDYLLTQCQVLVHYLRLAFWPTGQVLDYGWEFVHDARQVALQGSLLVVLILVSLVLLARRRWAGFCAFAFFLVLAPTSSVIPIEDAAFEHRMYLPLALLVVLVLGALAGLLDRVVGNRDEALRTTFGLSLPIALALGLATNARNAVYRSEDTMWTDVAAKRPNHPRAVNNLAGAQARSRPDDAVALASRAIELEPEDASAHYNMGLALEGQGKLDEAQAAYERAIALDATDWRARANLGRLFIQKGDSARAVQQLQSAMRINPNEPFVYFNLAFVQQELGNLRQAISLYDKATSLNAQYLDPDIMKALCLQALGELDESEATLRGALKRADPVTDGEALLRIHTNLGTVLFMAGRLDEAEAEYRSALEHDPKASKAWQNLGLVLENRGQKKQAARAFRRVLALEPANDDARAGLGRVGG